MERDNKPPSFPPSEFSSRHSRNNSLERRTQIAASTSSGGDRSPRITAAQSELELGMPAPHQIEETLQTFKWIEAIRSSDMAALTTLVKNYTQQQNLAFPFGTPLHLAAAFATRPIFEYLLKSLTSSTSFKINAVDKLGNTALHIASKAGRLSICEFLLKQGADCTISNNDGRDSSEVSKTQPILDLIVSHRKNFAQTKAKEMLNMANSGKFGHVQQLFQDSRVSKLVDINYQDPMSGDTLLHISCEQGNFDMVTWCLKMRADPLLRDKKGKLAVERTRNEKIKQILKAALNQPAFSGHHSTNYSGVKMQGVLYKWTNYAGGYKKRWFVLEDGVLSYYRSQEDVPVSCRGSISLVVAKIWIDGSDRNRFDVIGRGNVRYHLRADQPMEAKRWVIAITEAKQWLQDNEEFKNRMVERTLEQQQQQQQQSTLDLEKDELSDHSVGNDFRFHHSESMHTVAQSDDQVDVTGGYEENFNATINAAMAAVHSQKQLVQTILSVLDSQNSTYNQLGETFKKSSQSLLVTLNEILRLNNERERYWERRIEREEALKKVWEENLRSLAAEHDSLQQKAAEEVKNLESKARKLSLVDTSQTDDEDEFFDTKSDINIVQPPPFTTTIAASLKGYTQNPPDDLRKELPLSSADRVELSLWSVLKNNIGKDLSKIALPVFFNEPLSMLQRLCEDMEYSTLLDLACSKSSSIERLQFVAAFAMSNYSSTEGRAGKPFNPLLGETFEYVRKDRGFRYISEQVSHHPPISACFCESDAYIFWAEANLKNKFWGKSLEIFPQGTCHVILKKTGEHFSWKKVTTCVNNLIVGKLWIDHYGDMVVTNHKTGEVCTLTFKAAGWRGKSQYEIDGNVKDEDGKVKFELSGHWNDMLVSKHVGGHSTEHLLLWKRIPVAQNSSKCYNFTEFALTLNEITPGLDKWICKTDSRLRPDQKAMERGEYDLADQEKVRLEEAQRERRYSRQEAGDDWKPMWFKREIEADTGEEHWKYKGGYWEARDNNFSDLKITDLFN